VSGIDAHELRPDIPPRTQPVTEEERSDAAACSIYHAWLQRTWRRMFPDYATAAFLQVGESATKPLLHILEHIDETDLGFRVFTKGASGDSTLWDEPATEEIETRSEALLGALGETLTFLAERFGSPEMDEWLWGRLHGARFRHFFGQAGIPAYDLGPIPAPGGRHAVNVAGISLATDSFEFTYAPSQRLVVELNPAGIRAVNILPGGQNGNPGDLTKYNQINPAIHYGDLIPGWLNGETFEYRITHAAVAADNQRHLKYVPEE
jgi:penicillin amidase